MSNGHEQRPGQARAGIAWLRREIINRVGDITITIAVDMVTLRIHTISETGDYLNYIPRHCNSPFVYLGGFFVSGFYLDITIMSAMRPFPFAAHCTLCRSRALSCASTFSASRPLHMRLNAVSAAHLVLA